jgi:muconate cycloisomerase
MTTNGISRRGILTGSVALAGLVSIPVNAAGKTERLKITRVELFSVNVPFKPDVISSPELAKDDLERWGADALENVDKIPKIIVKLHTDSGLYGIGESGRGAKLEDARRNVTALLGKNVLDLNIPRIGLPGEQSSRAFEIACYDVVGKAIGWPVYQLLGGLVQDKVAVAYWCGRKNPTDIVRVAERATKGGFNVLKMKCHGHNDPIVATVQAVAKAAPGLRVNVDFNSEYATADEFLELGRALAAIGNMHTFEDPIPTADIAGFAKIRSTIPTPLTLTAHSPGLIYDAARNGACTYINTGPTPYKGSTPSTVGFQRNAAAAAAAGIPVWHGSGLELGILDAHMVHTCASVENCTLPSDIQSFLREHTLLTTPIRVEGGFAVIPTGPGLGVALDEDAVRRYRA